MDESASSLPFSSGVDGNTNRNFHHPQGLSFLGQSSSPDEQIIQDFNTWTCSTQGLFPSQPLQDPGQAGHPPRTIPGPPTVPQQAGHPRTIPNPPTIPRKRKRATSPERAAVGGYGPIPGNSHEEQNQQTPDQNPSRTIRFTERKNCAYDVWAFVRALETKAVPPSETWPDDHHQHLNKRPDSPFLGCKFCTDFG